MSGTNDSISKKIDDYAMAHLDQLRSNEYISKKDMSKYDVAAQMLANGILSRDEFEEWAFGTKEGQDSYNSRFNSTSIFGNGFSFGKYDTYDNGTYLDDITLTLEQNNHQTQQQPSPISASKTEQKQNLSQEQLLEQQSQQTRAFAADKLFQQAGNAGDNLTNYYNGIGKVSFDAVQQGLQSIGNYTWDKITGRNDFVTVWENGEAISNEIGGIIRLKNTTNNPEEFNKNFKELYGIDYNEQAFQNLQKADTNLQTLNAYQNLSDNISNTLSNIDNAAPVNVRKAAMLHILPHVGNNRELAQQYVSQLNSIAQNDDKKFVQELKSFLTDAKNEYDSQIHSLDKNTLEQEYKSAYKQAMGNYNSEEIINEYISNMKTQAAVIEIGTTIAASYFAMGSTAMQNLGSKAMQLASAKFGTKAGAMVSNAAVKGIATTATAAFNPAVTIVSDATSKKGITEQTGQEAWEELKNGMMYGAFGAYVSGPVGDSVAKILSKNPQIFKSIIPKIIGTGTETTADVIFDRLTSDMTIQESLSQNGLMNYGMMFAGSAIHKGAKLNNVNVEKQENGTYTLTRNGEVIVTAKNDNELALSVLLLGTKGYKVEGAPEALTFHPETPQQAQANIFAKQSEENHRVQQSLETSSGASQGRTQETQEVIREQIKTDMNEGTPITRQGKELDVPEHAQLSAPETAKIEIDDETFAKMKDELAETLKARGIGGEYANNILDFTNKGNIDLARELCNNPDFPKEHIKGILGCTHKDNIEFAREMCNNPDFPKKQIKDILLLAGRDKDVIDIARKMCNNPDFPKKQIKDILGCINKDNIEFARELYNDPDFPNEYMRDILFYSDKNNMDYAYQRRDLVKDMYNGDFSKERIRGILLFTDKDNIDIARKMCNNPDFPKEDIKGIMFDIYEDKDIIDLARELCNNPDFPKKQIRGILAYTNKDNINLARELCNNPDFPNEHIEGILLGCTNKDNIELARELCNNPDFPKEHIEGILRHINKGKDIIDIVRELCRNPDFPNERIQPLIDDICWARNDNVLKMLKNKDLVELDSKVKALKQKMLKNPEWYVNGEFETQELARDEVEEFVDSNYCCLMAASEIFDKEAVNHLLRMRFDDADEYIDILRDFSPDEMSLLKNLSESCNTDNKPFMPTQKIEFIDLITAYKANNMSFDGIQSMIDQGKVDVGQLNADLCQQIMKNSGLTDTQIASIPKDKLLSWDMNYIHLLSKEINSGNDLSFNDIMKAGSLEPDFNQFIHNTSNIYGIANENTRNMFETSGLNYEKWLHPSKEHEIHFVSKDKNAEHIEQIAAQVSEDINMLMQTPVKGFLKKQFPKFIKGDEFIIPKEYLSNKNKLKELIEMLSDTSEQGQLAQVWKRAQGNAANPDPKRAQTARNTLTILEHLNQRLDDISSVQEGKSERKLDLTIKMWDRNPQKDIFQGNYSTCCIGMGGGNGSAMPHFVMDTAYNMIELVDNTSGKTIGNALCYFIKDDNGKPAFIIDNIEINNKYKPSNATGVQVRSAMADYAAKVSQEITGVENTPVYMSGSYNDVPISDLQQEIRQVSFLGDIDCDEIYMDLYGGWTNKDKFTKTCTLYQLK